MLSDFVRFVQSLFPGIDPYVAERCLEAVKQHRTRPEDLISPPIGAELCQGDILDGIELMVPIRPEGHGRFRGLSMLVSNSCDIDNKPFMLIAPCFELSHFASEPRLADISRNTVTNLFCLTHIPGDRSIVSDLSLIDAVSVDNVKDRLSSGAARRVCSLSEVGWYLLISKLTVHLMRPETREVERAASGGSPPRNR